MATFTKEQVKAINDTATKVAEHALYQATRQEAQGIGEFMACEIIDLVEWMTEDNALQQAVASKVLSGHTWPLGCACNVKKYFNLPY